jgi:alkanesulfonate monooxygenase SsuD/methylene tetrahydromethanopterin reductase-like flavin-dependent oxidoreductase (luciferase family)
MRTGLLLPTLDPLRVGGPPQVVQTARRAEELGFDAVWAGDHLFCPAPVLDAPACLAAAAAATERVGLGLSVMLLALRPPAWAAKQLATIDALSGGGRLLLGVGVGGEFPEEFAAAGVPRTERGARVDETLGVLGDLLAGRAVRHAGRTLTLDIPPLEPAMAAPPPVYVGGRGEHALRRAARHGDAWLPMWLSPDAIAERAGRLAELADQHGRPRPRIALLIGVCVDDDRERARREAAEVLQGQYGLPLHVVERWTALGAAEDVAAHLEEHRAAGVSEVVLMPLARDRSEQTERLAQVRAHLARALAADTPQGAAE